MAGCPPAGPVPLPTHFATVHSAGAAAPHSYGGDSAGLVCGYLMQGSTPAKLLDSTEAAHWLHAHANPTTPPCRGRRSGPTLPFVWLHFNLAHAQALRWIQRHAQCPMRF